MFTLSDKSSFLVIEPVEPVEPSKQTSSKSAAKRTWKLPPLPLESELFIPPEDDEDESDTIKVTDVPYLVNILFDITKSNEKETIYNMKQLETQYFIDRILFSRICDVFEGLRILNRVNRLEFVWCGMEKLMPSLLILKRMSFNEKYGVNEEMNTRNIVMLTQILLIEFMRLPPPKIISVESAVLHFCGEGITHGKKFTESKKILLICTVLQKIGLLVPEGTTRRKTVSYRYIGPETPLVFNEGEKTTTAIEQLEVDNLVF